MSQSAAVNSSIVFDFDLFRQLAAAGVSIEHIASCFLVTVEELKAELHRIPTLLAAYSRGRGLHMIHMYNTLKNATSPTLIALMARTDGFGQRRKQSQTADTAPPESVESMAQAPAAAKKPEHSKGLASKFQVR